MNTNLIIYIGLGLAIIIVVLTQIAINRILQRRRNRIDSLPGTNPVITNTPFEKPRSRFKERAKAGVKNQFTIIRRTVFIIILIAVIFFIAFPFIDQIPQTLISIFVTSTAVIVGIAARPIIENFLSGIVITYSQKFNVGDTVLVDDVYGSIEDITPTHTVVKIWDWRRFVIPNREMLGQKIVNYSLYDSWHWAHVEFFVAPDSDLEVVKRIAIQTAQDTSYYEDKEEPTFWIMNMGKESIRCWIAAWASSPARSWELMSEIRTNLSISLRKENIVTHAYQHHIDGTNFND